jgi:hypothetical protein
MSPFFLSYVRPEPTTWLVLSIFSVIGLFVVFHRFWSMRNVDILLILAFIPGFMLVYEGRRASLDEGTNKSSTGTDGMSDGSNASHSKPSLDTSPDNSSVSATPSSGDQLSLTPTERIAPPEQESPSSESTTVRIADGAASAETISDVILNTSPEALRRRALTYWGFLNLLVCAGLLAFRMLFDTAIVRRPLLEPNLNSGGMLFIGSSLLLFLLFNVALSTRDENRKQGPDLGPGYILLSALPQISTDRFPIVEGEEAITEEAQATRSKREARRDMTARILAIGANLALIFCIVGIGYWHFGSFNTGVGAATFYLLLPYTAYTTGRVDHVVPGALLLLALLMYRQPFIAGLFLGCAAGVTYYPFSLLPLWCSFYWPRGIRRFGAGFVTALAALVVAMAILHPLDLMVNLSYMFGIKPVAMTDMDGIWALGWHPYIRIPIMVLFVLLSMSFVVWPAQKNLATLMSCTAALMAATQFWHGFGGGLYMAWFLPLAILTIFRPNLDYCVALEVVRPLKRKPKAMKAETVEKATMAAAVATTGPAQMHSESSSPSTQAKAIPSQPRSMEKRIQRGVHVDGVLFGFLRWIVLRLTIFVPSAKTNRT